MARKLEVSEFMTRTVERNLVRHGIERIRGRGALAPRPDGGVDHRARGVRCGRRDRSGLASIAMEQARVAVGRAFGFEFKAATDGFRPTYVFSIPEAAWVGRTEEPARSAGIDYEVGRSSFGTNAKARISGFPDGLVKLVFRCRTGRSWAYTSLESSPASSSI
jgi:Pyridine nucleotide-disulphide oxidoreductase, dimerisation domain